MVKNCNVAGCLIFEDSKLLLMEHTTLGVWIHPGGHIRKTETPGDAAMREVKEETGLDVDLIDCSETPLKLKGNKETVLPMPLMIVDEKVFNYPDNPRYKDNAHRHVLFLYLAKIKGKNRRLKMNFEAKRMGWFRKSELGKLKLFKAHREIYNYAFRKMPG